MRQTTALFFTLTMIALAILYFPLMTIFAYSLLDHTSTFDPVSQWTLKWYLELFDNQELLQSTFRSLSIALATGISTAILGTLGAIGLEEGRFPLKTWIEAILFAPFLLPDIVFGLAFLMWFSLIRVTLGWHSILLAHITFSVPYVVAVVRHRYRELDPALIEAAFDLGATRPQLYFHVIFPLLLPALVSSACLAMVISFDDFMLAFFTGGVNGDTLPLKIYKYTKIGVNPQLFALSTLLMGANAVAIGVVMYLQGPSDKR